jgi:hypothetical protein
MQDRLGHEGKTAFLSQAGSEIGFACARTERGHAVRETWVGLEVMKITKSGVSRGTFRKQTWGQNVDETGVSQGATQKPGGQDGLRAQRLDQLGAFAESSWRCPNERIQDIHANRQDGFVG